jgi:CelD/BcsL family acetyltransferase involved in cellulose biosynthesis
MTTTVAEAIKHAIDKGLKTVNLSAGNDVSKTCWSPTEHTFRETVEVAPRLKSRMVQNARDKVYAMRQSPDWQKSTLGKLVRRFGRNSWLAYLKTPQDEFASAREAGPGLFRQVQHWR